MLRETRHWFGCNHKHGGGRGGREDDLQTVNVVVVWGGANDIGKKFQGS